MHISVLQKELIEYMDIKPSGVYVDCTGGGGGHAALALEKLNENGRLLVLDRDADAVARLGERFVNDKRVSIAHANFADIDLILEALELGTVDGIYADFGVSSFQLTDGSRGFSFRQDGPLDMRMDTTKGVTASEIVNNFTGENIATIITKFGEDRFAKRIAYAIVKRRAFTPFSRTLDLAEVIKNAVPKKFHKKGIHPATQSFQAFRIFVNGELEAILGLMSKLSALLKVGGRFAAISFHSLEDRIVKESLNAYAKPCTCPPVFPICVCGKTPEFRIILRKPLTPTEKEIEMNPLSRSAKLRAAERI